VPHFSIAKRNKSVPKLSLSYSRSIVVLYINFKVQIKLKYTVIFVQFNLLRRSLSRKVDGW
jgi:hypothetical protein